MSQENVELFYRAIDAFNRRDLDALLALMDDDVEAIPRGARMEGSYHGHDGIRRLWENVFAVWPDFTVQAVEVHDLGDLTVAALRTRGHGAGSDIPLDESVWQVARSRGGKCVWWGTFDTWAEALEAVGLPEQDAQADS
jgi:ketosteroid isomerase-like protein